MRILLVEDEPRLAASLKKGLSENGYVVDTAADGIDGRHLAVTGQYDIVILDVMIPGIDGFAVLKAIRTSTDVAVLMLTARDRVEDRVRGLQEGADDYLVKPFAFSELLARLTALRRRGVRSQAADSSMLVMGTLQLDLARKRASRDGLPIDLTAKEFVLLALLMRRRGEVLSKAVIAEQVWDINFDGDSKVVEVAVHRLRAKVDDPFEKKLLKTVRGFGYVLELDE